VIGSGSLDDGDFDFAQHGGSLGVGCG
jgi:hypothetical protein